VKHTPGPWRVAPAADYVGAELNVDAKQRGFICAAGTRGDAEAEANAKLIASAPSLLTALEGLCKALGDLPHNALDQASFNAYSRAVDVLEPDEFRERFMAQAEKRSHD
jgi:hypothetical protein